MMLAIRLPRIVADRDAGQLQKHAPGYLSLLLFTAARDSIIAASTPRRSRLPEAKRFLRPGSFSTKMACPCHVRFTPDSVRTADIAGGPVRATGRDSCTAAINISIRSPHRRGRAALGA